MEHNFWGDSAPTYSPVLANTLARDPLVPLTSPWDMWEDADERSGRS